MFKNLKKKEEGFTIIEVLIVLAIAGLIMLVVFLAVPALQRNSRNTQRNNDASLVLAAVNECLNNKNGVQASCDTMAATELGAFLDVTRLRQLTTVGFAVTVPTNNTTVNVAFARRCNPAGDAPVPGNARQFAALYNLENTTGGNIGRCIES